MIFRNVYSQTLQAGMRYSEPLANGVRRMTWVNSNITEHQAQQQLDQAGLDYTDVKVTSVQRFKRRPTNYLRIYVSEGVDS